MRGCNRRKDSEVGKNAACSMFSFVLIFLCVFERGCVCVYDMYMCMYMMCICMMCVYMCTLNISQHACKDQRRSSTVGPCLSL